MRSHRKPLSLLRIRHKPSTYRVFSRYKNKYTPGVLTDTRRLISSAKHLFSVTIKVGTFTKFIATYSFEHFYIVNEKAQGTTKVLLSQCSNLMWFY